jgi:hypothetical protein
MTDSSSPMKHCDEVGCPNKAVPGGSYCSGHLEIKEEFWDESNDGTAPGDFLFNPDADFWGPSKCHRCKEEIHRGDPRCVVMLAELGIGQGHREYDPSEDGSLDEDCGLLGQTALSFCRPCAGIDAQFTIENPWFQRREDATSPQKSRSVRAIPLSRLKVNENDLEGDILPDDGPRSAVRTEAEDRFVTVHSDNAVVPPMRQDDLRYRMGRHLLTPEGQKLRGRTRKVLELWVTGIKQKDVAVRTGVSQAKVSRIIRDARKMNYS